MIIRRKRLPLTWKDQVFREASSPEYVLQISSRLKKDSVWSIIIKSGIRGNSVNATSNNKNLKRWNLRMELVCTFVLQLSIEYVHLVLIYLNYYHPKQSNKALSTHWRVLSSKIVSEKKRTLLRSEKNAKNRNQVDRR